MVPVTCPPMELRPWLLWVIAAAGPLVLLVADAQGQEVFTNTWAVHISGGPAVADRLARKHGFLNQGQVGVLTACRPTPRTLGGWGWAMKARLLRTIGLSPRACSQWPGGASSVGLALGLLVQVAQRTCVPQGGAVPLGPLHLLAASWAGSRCPATPCHGGPLWEPSAHPIPHLPGDWQMDSPAPSSCSVADLR